MFPNMFCGSCKPQNPKRNQMLSLRSPQPMTDIQFRYPIPYDIDLDDIVIGTVSMDSVVTSKKSGRGRMRKTPYKVFNFSDVIRNVTAASCFADNRAGEIDSEEDATAEESEYKTEIEPEMVMLMGEVFERVSSMKTAYVSLQEAHYPWDPDKMRLSDMAVVAELRKLGVLRERFRRSVGGGAVEAARRKRRTVAEVVAPYETAMEKLTTELKNKEREVEELSEKLKTALAVIHGGGRSNGRKNRSNSRQSKRKISCTTQLQVSPAPSPELFESCMSSVADGSKSFTSLLLSLMKAANWDIAATVRSITNAGTAVGPNHAKHALESYVNRKIFHGFDHETFDIDGTPSSHPNPGRFQTDYFAQYHDMKSLDPTELLGILPTCPFGRFCSKKYLSTVHPKMEESLFGDLDQRRQVLAGNHPRSRFYGEFLEVAKAVWLLHLLAFSMDPLPSHFEASRGAEFHREYMESVVRTGGGRVAAGHVVGFPVSPGFKLGNGYVVKARVYLVPRREL